MEEPRVVVMGPSATGKSTVGEALAAALGVPFIDGDALHPPANTAKMAAGIALDDYDRWPWLDTIGSTLTQSSGGAVIACSALRRAYRDRIRSHAPEAWFLELDLTVEQATSRAANRTGHFMPASLVASQFALWERLAETESGLVHPAIDPVEQIVAAAIAALR